MPNIRWLLAFITNFHRFVYLKSDGRLGAGGRSKRFLLLWNKGRKTGQQRITPLLYVEDGPNWIVVASNAGDSRPPGWWLNLQAQPRNQIQVKRERYDVVARRADEGESRSLWPRLESVYGYFPEYRERAEREIPIVILEREGPVAPA